MDVKMHGRNFQIDDRFRELAESKISRAAKFFENVGSADVEVTEEKNPRIADERFRVEITASAAGNVVRVEGAAGTPGSGARCDGRTIRPADEETQGSAHHSLPSF